MKIDHETEISKIIDEKHRNIKKCKKAFAFF